MSRSKKHETKRERKKRLKGCKDAKARYLEEMDANPRDPRHGTRKGYSYGCRCVECVEAQRRWWREEGRLRRWDRWIAEGRTPRIGKARLLAEMAADPEHPDHGTATGYFRGCRCDKCREAYNAYKRERYARGKETKLAKDAREVKEGLEAYRLWLSLGGTPEGWRESMEITVEC